MRMKGGILSENRQKFGVFGSCFGATTAASRCKCLRETGSVTMEAGVGRLCEIRGTLSAEPRSFVRSAASAIQGRFGPAGIAGGLVAGPEPPNSPDCHDLDIVPLTGCNDPARSCH